VAYNLINNYYVTYNNGDYIREFVAEGLLSISSAAAKSWWPEI